MLRLLVALFTRRRAAARPKFRRSRRATASRPDRDSRLGGRHPIPALNLFTGPR